MLAPYLKMLARLYGVERTYIDLWGKRHQASPEQLKTILELMGIVVNDSKDAQALIQKERLKKYQRRLPAVLVTSEEIKKIQTNNNKNKQINDMSKNVEENNPTLDNNVKENSTQNEIELCRNPECKKPLKKGAKRCTCGLDVKTEKKCPKCNFVDDDIEAKFCPNCDEKVELV